MASRTRKGNTVDSLFRGIVQGLNLGTQLNNQRRARELQSRSLDLTKEGLDIKKDTLDLQLQKQQQAGEFFKQMLPLFQGLTGAPQGGAPQPGGASQPSPISSIISPVTERGTNADLAGTPAVPATVGSFQPPNVQARTPGVFSPQGITESPAELPPGGRVTPPVRSRPLQTPTPQSTAGFGQVPQPQTRVTPTQVPAAPDQTPGAARRILEDSARNAVQQFDVALSRPDSPTTVTLQVPGGGSLSRTIGKNPTADQLFTRFNAIYRKLSPEQKIKALQGSALADSEAAQKFFNREFDRNVNEGLRIKERAFRLDNKRLPNKTERNQLLATAINNEVEQFNGFVSKRHEKMFQEQDIQSLGISEGLKTQLLKMGVTDEDDLRRRIADDPEGTAALIDRGLANESNLPKISTTLKVQQDGTLTAITETRDGKGNINFTTTDISEKDFTPSRVEKQSSLDKAAEKIIIEESKLLPALDDAAGTINQIGKDFLAVPKKERDAVLGLAGDFNAFTNTVIDNLKGLSASSLVPGTPGARNVLDAFQQSDAFQNIIGKAGAKSQKLFTQYSFLLLKTAAIIGLGQGRALSDKDLDFVKNVLNRSGATSFESSISALNAEVNRRRKQATDTIRGAQSGKIFKEKGPNPDPFASRTPQTSTTPQTQSGNPVSNAESFLDSQGF